MTALTQDRESPQYGTFEPYPTLLSYGVAANTTIYAGAMVALNASGYAVPASSVAALKVIGRCERDVVNQTTAGAGIGTNGALNVQIRQGVFAYNNPSSGADNITIANLFQNCYASDDNTLTLTDGGGTRPLAGTIYGIGGNVGPSDLAGQVFAFLGLPSAYSSLLSGGATAFIARAVITSLPDAYTGSGTNVLTETTPASGLGATQDSITIVAGQTVLLQEGQTNLVAAKDAGPWIVTTLGTASLPWILTRPDWWTTGSPIPQAQVIKIAEGTIFAGTDWKVFAGVGKIIGTDDPVLWVGRINTQVTLSSGGATITNLCGIRSLTETFVGITRTVLNGSTMTTTVQYAASTSAGATGITQGVYGTGAIALGAMVAAGTSYDASDVSKLNVQISNW
jgi:hypothetical protein